MGLPTAADASAHDHREVGLGYGRPHRRPPEDRDGLRVGDALVRPGGSRPAAGAPAAAASAPTVQRLRALLEWLGEGRKLTAAGNLTLADGKELACLRTTVTLDPDVVAELKELARQRGVSFKEVLNDAVRAGMAAGTTPRAYRLPTTRLGLRGSCCWRSSG